MAKKTDEKTLELIQAIKRQKEEISKAERPNWITNCSFSYAGNASINLHAESNIRTLVMIVAFLLDRERAYSEAAGKLGVVDAPAFSWDGYSTADWTEDIKTRINKIQITSKKKKLEALETRLNAIISPELRAEIELDAISKDLEE